MYNLSQLSDEDVIEIVRTQNRDAYAVIIRRYQAKLLRYASYILGDEQAGADAVQESFIKAYVNLHGFNLKMKFSSWIYRIVHNEALNVIQKQKKYLYLEDQLDFNSGLDLEDDFIKKELATHAHHCLQQMPFIYKEPLSLFFLEEKSYEEISDILRIPIGTVGTRINRAKAIMEKICKKNTK